MAHIASPSLCMECTPQLHRGRFLILQDLEGMCPSLEGMCPSPGPGCLYLFDLLEHSLLASRCFHLASLELAGPILHLALGFLGKMQW